MKKKNGKMQDRRPEIYARPVFLVRENLGYILKGPLLTQPPGLCPLWGELT